MKLFSEEMRDLILEADKDASEIVEMVKKDIWHTCEHDALREEDDRVQCTFKNIKIMKNFYQKSSFNIVKDALIVLLKRVKGEKSER